MKSKCEIFGVLNVTPDSFSNGGEFLSPEKAISHAEKMFADGADFVDVGGQSTRPGAMEISWQEEWGRVEKVLDVLLGARHSAFEQERISLDTLNPETARKFLEMGGRILNDVSGFQDSRMIDLAVRFTPIVIVNHFPLRLRSFSKTQETSKTIAEVHKQVEISSINQVCDDLLSRKEALLKAGVSSEKIILDPGIGFGKTMELNWALLQFPKLLPDERVMIGHSRKRFLGEERFSIEKNLEAARIAIDAGAAYLRVHDVAEHKSIFN